MAVIDDHRIDGRRRHFEIAHVVNEADGAATDTGAPKRNIANFRPADAGVMLACAAASGALCWLLFYLVTTVDSLAGYLFCSYLGFLALYGWVERERSGRLVARDRLMTAVVGTCAFMMIVPLTYVLVTVVAKGWNTFRPAFFTDTMEGVGPLTPPDQGGAFHAIVGTVMQVGIAGLISVPLGIACAVFLNEVGGRLALPVRTIVNAMSGVPSIVAGLFIYAVWILQFGQGYSGFAAALALSVLMLPSVTRTAEETLRLVPGGLREASLALGSHEWRAVWSVVLPTAKAGLLTAVILGTARVLGETAPLLLTSFGAGATSLNLNPFDGPQSALPVFVYTLYQSPTQVQVDRAWTGALVLVILVLALFMLARVVGSRPPGTQGWVRRTLRRR